MVSDRELTPVLMRLAELHFGWAADEPEPEDLLCSGPPTAADERWWAEQNGDEG